MSAIVETSPPRKRFKRQQPDGAMSSARRWPKPRRLARPHSVRRVVQITFLGICLWIGWNFTRFYDSCLAPDAAIVSRPPGVEAFLPISALMSFRLWLQTGAIHPVHPAGLLIFAAVLAIAFLFKRSFCSWVCPLGLLSETLAAAGCRIFRRNFSLPPWADWPLRSLKYWLLGFFADVIFCRMDLAGLREFLDSPFNRVADVRLLQFFLHPGTTTVVVLVILAGLSLFVRHFWCRYLCPYGALTALAGLASPTRIRRDVSSCIDCQKCSRACPAALPVHRLLTVRSDECTLCLECTQACPVPDTLVAEAVFFRSRVGPLTVALVIAGIFFLVVVGGKLSGHWQTFLTPSQQRQQIQWLQRSAGHP